MFAIKTCRVDVGAETIVGHLPIEVSRLTKFLLDRGATVTATLTSKSYRRSPLVQGGLEIPCLVQAKMIGTQINKIILSKYLNMIKETYVEPDPDETIIAGVPADLVPPRIRSPGPNPLADSVPRTKSASGYGPPRTKFASGFCPLLRIWSPFIYSYCNGFHCNGFRRSLFIFVYFRLIQTI